MNQEWLLNTEKINCKGIEYKGPSKLFNLDGFILNRYTHEGNRLLFSKTEGYQTSWVSIVYDLKYPIIKYYKTFNDYNFISNNIDIEEITEDTFIHSKEYRIDDLREKYNININKGQFYYLIGKGSVLCQEESLKNKYYITKLPSTFFIKIIKEFGKESKEQINLLSIILKGIKFIDEDDINSRFEKYYLFYKIIDNCFDFKK